MNNKSEPAHRFWVTVRRLWDRLTQPSALITDHYERYQARLLSALVLLLIVISAVLVCIQYAGLPDYTAYNGSRYVLAGGMAVICVIYGVSRTRYYRYAVLLLIGLVSLAALVMMFPDDSASYPSHVIYFVIPVLLAGVWLSLRRTMVLAAVQIAVLISMVLIVPDVDLGHLWLDYVFVLLIIQIVYYRSQIEHEQQAALAESEARYRGLVDHAPLMIAIHSKGTIDYVNPYTLKLLGADDESQVIGRPVLDFVHVDDVEAVRRRIVQTQKEGLSAEPLEEKFIRLDGQIINMEVSTIPFTFKGEPALQVVARDLTRQNQAIQALLQSEQRYRYLFERSLAGIYRSTFDGQILDCNNAFARLLGYESPDDLARVGTRALYFNETDRDSLLDRLEREGSLQQCETMLKRKDGRPVWLLEEVLLLKDDGEQPIIQGMAVDITDLKTTSDTLRRSEATNRALLDAIPDLIFRFDREGTFLDVKQSAMGLLYPPYEFLGKPIHDIMPDLADETVANIQRALDTGVMQRFEYQLNVQDEVYHYEARVVASSDDDVLVIVRDETERKRSEAALLESESRYRSLFEDSPVSLWNEDFSTVKQAVDDLRASGVVDLAAYFEEHPDEVRRLAGLVKICDVNQATLDLFEYDTKAGFYERLSDVLISEVSCALFRDEVLAFASGESRFQRADIQVTPLGKKQHIVVYVSIVAGCEETWAKVLVSTVDITKRKEADEALRLSEERFRQMAETGLNGLTIIENGKTVYINDRLCEIYGYSRDELLTMPEVDLVAPEEKARFQRIRLAAQETGIEPKELEFWIVRKNGDRRCVNNRYSVTVDENDIARCYITTTDTTDRRHTEDALRQSEAQNRALLAAVPDLMFRMNREGLYLEIQAHGPPGMLYRPPEQLLGRWVNDVFEPELAEIMMTKNQQVLDAGVMQVFEYRLPVPLGLRDFEARLVVSGPDEVLWIVRDITERKQAEAAIKREQELFMAGPLVVFQGSPQNDIPRDYVSPNVSQFGYTADDFTRGRVLYCDFIHPEDTARVQAEAEVLTAASVSFYEQDYRIVTAAGAVRWVYDFTIVTRDKDGNATHYDSYILDITERKQAEDALNRRDSILKTLALITEQLLTAPDLDTILSDVLAQLTRTIGVQRTYVFENQEAAGTGWVAHCRALWSKPGFEITSAPLQGGSITHVFERWVQVLRDGRPLFSLVSDLPEAERAVLQPMAIRSIALVPIFDGGRWWGFVGFEDCEQDREWLSAEIEALRSVVGTLGTAFIRQQTEAAEREQRMLAEALRYTTAAVNSTLQLDDVLERILTGLVDVLPHDAANVMLLSGDRVRLAGTRGYADQPGGQELYGLDVSLTLVPLLEKCMHDREILIVADAHQEPEWHVEGQTTWVRAHISAPIVAEDQVIGFLNLDSTQPNIYNTKHGEWLEAFADQAAIAIHNARLYDDLARNAEELMALNRATSFLFTSLPATTELPDLCQRIAGSVVKEFEKAYCSLLLVDIKSGQLVRLGEAGEYTPPTPKKLATEGAGLVAAAVRSGQTVYAPDVAKDERYLANAPRTRSELAIPLVATEGVIGAIDLQSTELGFVSEQEQNVLEAFAERVAATIENRLLVSEIEGYTDELEQRVTERTIDLSVRNAVAETLSSSLDVNEMLGGVLQTIVEQLKVVGGAIYLLHENSHTLELAARMGVSPEALKLVTGITPDTTDLGLMQRVLGMSDDRLANGRKEAAVSAVLSVPVWRQGRMQGVITLAHDHPRLWTIEERRMLDAIGRQIAGALANARLYSETVQREAHIRAILRNVADGLLVFDQDNNLVLMNPAAEALFAFYPVTQGGAPGAAIRLWRWLQTYSDLSQDSGSTEFMLPAETVSVNMLNGVFEPCAVGGCPYGYPIVPGWPCWLTSDAASRDQIRDCSIFQRLPRHAIQAHSAKVRDMQDAEMGTVIVLHDVTYFRELDDLKGRFVSTVSHELRTPLSAVLLQVSTLLKYYERFAEDERRDMLGEIQQQAYVLRELIEDILELSRFDAKRALPHKDWFDLAEQCREQVFSMRPVISEKQLEIELKIPTEACMIRGDAQQLARAYNNLLSNAIKYTPQGGRIAVHLTRVDDEYHLEVIDTGIGIRPDEQVYVFDRFFRSETASQIASGTGLGLSITKEIVDLHRGRIDVHSTPDQGSTFIMILPVNDTRGPERIVTTY
ncbi:MAG: PAS domain S-box protein [Anaerolineae bacterium]|nr:PAS domain S-box protein [Anaerolineae bacterium]